MRILIIGPSNIGDAILASPVIASVRSHFPQAHLTLVVGSRAMALFRDDPRIQTLINADETSYVLGRIRLMISLLRYHPNAVVDLRNTLFPLVLSPLSAWRYLRKPPRKITHMHDRHLWKMRAQLPQAIPLEHRSSLSFSKKDTAQVEQLWRRWNLNSLHHTIIICPGARSHIKRWMSEEFAILADRLITEAEANVVFAGEPSEEPIIEEILKVMHKPAHRAVGLTTIRQLGLIMQRAQLVITNDSAALHMASALQTPTIAIFGPTNEGKYGPTSAQSRVIRRRLFCAPCEVALCSYNHECMRFIPANEVYDAAIQLLDANKQQAR